MTQNRIPDSSHAHQLRKRALPSIEELRSKLCYDPETGIIVRRDLISQVSGRRADNSTHKGYRLIKINRHPLRAHRVAFALMTGRWPHMIDHIDRNRANNSWSNLRETTSHQNTINSKRNDKSKNIFRNHRNGWKIHVDGRQTTRARFCHAWKLRSQWLAKRDRNSAEHQPDRVIESTPTIRPARTQS